MLDTIDGVPRNLLTVWVGLLVLTSGLILNYVFERYTFFGVRDDFLYPVLCFFLIITGVALAIGGLAHASIRRLLVVASPFLVCLTIVYVGLCVGVQVIQTGADRLGECPALDQAAARSNVIPESKRKPGQPAVGCAVERRGIFLSYYNTLGVYGVIDAAAQQRVLDNLTAHYRQAHTHPLRVIFYEKENWTTRQGSNGVTFGFRGPESIIRIVNIG